tara:strand:+ start:2627 stop:2959 length:333 start_codon:yes stop_codon:yes gene_type:complete
MNLESKNTANVSTTKELLNKYLGEELKEYSIDPQFGAYAMENTFGEKIHAQVKGFCKFAEERFINDVEDNGKRLIKMTLSHDLGGAISNDKQMLPRVDGYEKIQKMSHDK